MWGKVSCLRKQHDGRDQDSNRSSELKSNTLTTTPPHSHKQLQYVTKVLVCYLRLSRTAAAAAAAVVDVVVTINNMIPL